MGFSCVMLAMATFSAWRITLPTRSGQSRQQQAGKRHKADIMAERGSNWGIGAGLRQNGSAGELGSIFSEARKTQ